MYLFFVYPRFYPSGGIHDLVGIFENVPLPEVRQRCEARMRKMGEETCYYDAHLVEMFPDGGDGRIIDAWEDDGETFRRLSDIETAARYGWRKIEIDFRPKTE